MKPKILVITPPHINIAEPFKTELEKHGFDVTVVDSSPLQSRSPYTEEFALVVYLWQNDQHKTGDAVNCSHPFDAAFFSPHRAFPGSIQLFQNGVYRLGADIDKFVDTVKELYWEHHASCQREQSKRSGDPDPGLYRASSAGQPATSIKRPATSNERPDLIGQSPQIKDVRRLANQLSQKSNLTVLITGPTGAGKEVVARLLHRFSPRADGLFIAVNCGAIPKDLFESLFFGYRKGAFTGATADHPGYIGQAQGGTLFLDEISTLTLEQQVKLLRFLQDRRYTPVGGTKEQPCDVTIVAATNEDLKTLVAEGRLREDLYHRLNVFEIILPPLRERGGDILLLAEHFLRTCPHGRGAQPKKLARKSRTLLLQYHYPGNVRELQNIIEKAIIAAGPSTIIRPEHLPLQLAEALGHGAGHKKIKTLREMEREHILTVYKNCGCKIKETARQLDIARNTLRERLEEYGIRL
ncbi:sigma-54 dependent transcriptional regulator [candidate division KSB1 bacterium]|nr:sigma-54 dependent transcriptional regulator [candidate division KSB1 bacterium]